MTNREYTHTHTHTRAYTHTHTHTYIYVYVSIFRQHFFVNANFIKHNRQFMSTYFLRSSVRIPVLLLSYLGGIDLYIVHHHHHHIVLVARISLTLSLHSSLSFIALGRSSGQHPVSSHSCWMYVRAGCPAFARPCVGVHKSTSLMSSSLLLQQCPACLVRLTWIVFVIGGRWLYSWCLVGCCRQDLFKIARSILV